MPSPQDLRQNKRLARERAERINEEVWVDSIAPIRSKLALVLIALLGAAVFVLLLLVIYSVLSATKVPTSAFVVVSIIAGALLLSVNRFFR